MMTIQPSKKMSDSTVKIGAGPSAVSHMHTRCRTLSKGSLMLKPNTTPNTYTLIGQTVTKIVFSIGRLLICIK